MILGTRFKRIVYALLLTGVALLLFLRHQEIEETGSLRWFDRPVIFLVSPAVNAFRATQESIRSIFKRYVFLIHLEKKSEEQESSLEEMRGRLLFLEAMNKENTRLRNLLNLKNQLSGNWTAARVVSMPPISPYRILTIDKGSEEGVVRRAAVVSPDGLVGQVSRVFPHSSQVLLITDPTSAVDARIDNTDSRALIVGKVMKTKLDRDFFITAFDYLSQTTEIAEGAKVITSGMDGVYPPGILIGSVHGSKKKKYDIFQQAEVLPAVNFFKLQEVLVRQ